MKQFFEEYGAVVIILIVIAALLILVGTVNEDGKTGKGLAGVIATAFDTSVTSFTNKMTQVAAKIPLPGTGE